MQPRGSHLPSPSGVPSKERPPKAQDLTSICLHERGHKEWRIAAPKDKTAQADPGDLDELSARARGCSSLAPGLPPSRDCGPGVHSAHCTGEELCGQGRGGSAEAGGLSQGPSLRSGHQVKTEEEGARCSRQQPWTVPHSSEMLHHVKTGSWKVLRSACIQRDGKDRETRAERHP